MNAFQRGLGDDCSISLVIETPLDSTALSEVITAGSTSVICPWEVCPGFAETA
jgi:hypothetical protein